MKSSGYPALIIDDDEDLCRLLVSVLARNNIHASTAHTLKDAEHCLKEVRPRLVLLDNNLPDGLGIDFIKKIREFDRTIKVIMITGSTAENLQDRAEVEGIDLFVPKPFSFESLRIRANDIMQKSA
jgi:two-component system, OmpR family, response regulator